MAQKHYTNWCDLKIWPNFAEFGQTEFPKCTYTDIYYKLEKIIRYPKNDLFNSKLRIFIGDIVHIKADAIINAAEQNLLCNKNNGIDYAIHNAAGPDLLKECKKLLWCDTGNAKLTKAYNLPCKYIIHTVPPIHGNEELLTECYRNSFILAREMKIKSIVFPCLGIGFCNYPYEKACRVALKVVRAFLKRHADEIDCIVFCMLTVRDYNVYCNYLQYFFPFMEEEVKKVNVQKEEEELDEEHAEERQLQNILKDVLSVPTHLL